MNTVRENTANIGDKVLHSWYTKQEQIHTNDFKNDAKVSFKKMVQNINSRTLSFLKLIPYLHNKLRWTITIRIQAP